MGQPRLLRFRSLQQSTTNVDPPFDNPSTPPQFTLSPISSRGTGTISCVFMYTLPPGTSAVPPFVWTPWVRDPSTGLWGSGAASPSLMDRQLFNFEVDAAEVSLIPTDNGNTGLVTMHLAEA